MPVQHYADYEVCPVSSLDTHRYQVQRHARKLGGRAFSPAYRLAPQYPFPCAILDSLAAYLFLLDPPPGASHKPVLPSSIILAGDSAGGGAVLALLVTIRDQGLPMPAGANLFSPWVDLCHSFPSVVENRATDYIPGNGFHFKSSLAWPPVMEEPFLVQPEHGREGDPEIRIYEQIQMYTTNTLLNHPMVSPVNMGSLGGLCPLLVVSTY
jgi:acetyl esterase/lipase